MVEWKQEYIDLFLAKAKEIGFVLSEECKDMTSEKAKREAYRYLLVCGLIPVTKENLELAPLEEFSIDIDLLPKNVQKKIDKIAQQSAEEWEYDEKVDTREKEDRGWKVHSVWIKKGKVLEAQVHKEITDNYITPKLNIKVR